jgi:hypothetical protein
MSGLNADNLLAAAAVWVAIMLPSAAFGGAPVQTAPSIKQCPVMEVLSLDGIERGPGLDRAA